MYPIGHVAFSYLLARPAIRRQPSVAELASLTAGAVFPAVSNVAIKNLGFLEFPNFWSHSPLLLIPFGLLGALVGIIPSKFRWVPLLFAVGVASHLVTDIIFDFPLIYLSNDVDDIGGPWFFPWRPFLFRYTQPGFDIQPWALMLEGMFFFGILQMRKRWDMVVVGVIAAVGTMIGIFWLGE